MLIDTPEAIQQLKKGDTLFCAKKKANFIIDEVCEDFVIVKESTDPQLFRSIHS